MSAKTHTHGTNREKPHKSKDQEKKVVFKSVLDNPFRIRWPSVPVNMQNLILAQIISLLEDLSTYNRTRSDESRKRKREAHTEQAARKKQKTGNEANAPNQESTAMEMEADLAPAIDSSNPSSSTKHPPPAPRIQKHLVVGINAVTKRLEYQIQKTRHTVTVSTSSLSTPSTDLPLPSIKYLFVCRADVDPPILIDHLPHLVASYNSAKPSDPIKLVPLPKGAEFTLAKCLNVRRVAAFALDSDIHDLSTLAPLLESVPSLAASWLAPVPLSAPVIPTHIKQVRTTAPTNMKAAKEDRNAGRANAKKKRKEKKKGPVPAEEEAMVV
ncbi:hypothetical protein CPB85DRAFT_1265553 [Mucidula mucida]|nr:hypothetical protein CPB85DRAFT_1265553 [Mucidula mucida]